MCWVAIDMHCVFRHSWVKCILFPSLMHVEVVYNWCLVHLNASGRLNVELTETSSQSYSLNKTMPFSKTIDKYSSGNLNYNVKNNQNELLHIVLFSLRKEQLSTTVIDMGFPRRSYATVFAFCILLFWKSKNSQNILIHCALSHIKSSRGFDAKQKKTTQIS